MLSVFSVVNKTPKNYCENMISDETLLELNSKGLIPGPGETEEQFLERAEYSLNLKKELESTSEELLKPACAAVKQLYGINPSWVPLFFSNKDLLPWHGGCACIFQEENRPPAAFLQLRRPFAKQETYLGLYKRDELIAHELCHVGRICFEEPRFEEILAYRTSSSPFQSWLGAIAQAPWETMLFFLSLCAALFVDIVALFWGVEILLWIKLLPVVLFLAALFRLIHRRRQFFGCLDHLKTTLQSDEKASGLIYRLTDAEIIAFSKKVPIKEKKDSTLRWRLIQLAYL